MIFSTLQHSGQFGQVSSPSDSVLRGLYRSHSSELLGLPSDHTFFSSFDADDIVLSFPCCLCVQHVPFLAVCIVVALSLTKLVPFTTLAGTVFGLLVSWSYLRFYQWQGSGSDRYRGDHSQAFSFASLFPELLQ